MITVKEIAWFAGLLEGEGSFCFSRTPRLDVQMTDEDVIAESARLLGLKRPSKSWQSKKHPHYKPLWRVTACGARAAGWMMTIYPLMGERRQAQIRGILEQWKASSTQARMPRPLRGQPTGATCHPEKKRAAYGLCQTCYMREWRAKRRLAPQEV